MVTLTKRESYAAPSLKLQAAWLGLRSALDAAAAPFTGQTLALPGFYAHDLPGASEELDRALKDMPAGSHASFDQDEARNLKIRLSRAGVA